MLVGWGGGVMNVLRALPYCGVQSRSAQAAFLAQVFLFLHAAGCSIQKINDPYGVNQKRCLCFCAWGLSFQSQLLSPSRCCKKLLWGG